MFSDPSEKHRLHGRSVSDSECKVIRDMDDGGEARMFARLDWLVMKTNSGNDIGRDVPSIEKNSPSVSMIHIEEAFNSCRDCCFSFASLISRA